MAMKNQYSVRSIRERFRRSRASIRPPCPLGVDFDDLIAAMQEYVDKFVAPIWATPAKLIKSTGFVKGAGRWSFSTTPISRGLSPITT